MGRRKRDLTQEDILAWADNLDSIPTVVTAKRQGVSVEAIRRRRIKCANFIAEKFDINEYRMPLYGLYGLFLNSVIHGLKKYDTTMTIAFGRGMGLFKEKQEIDVNERILLPDNELAKLIQNACPDTLEREVEYSEVGDGSPSSTTGRAS